MPDLIQHIEKYLGTIRHGWNKTPEGGTVPFQIVECTNGMLQGVVSYVTLGLSATPLISRQSGRTIRQELFLFVRAVDESTEMPRILQTLGLRLLESGVALLRGDVIWTETVRSNLGKLNSFYVTLPVYLPDSFSTHVENNGHPVVLSWLVPISDAEARYVRSEGWSQFEDLLQRENPDLLDLERMSLV
jgi:hypothetical protein